MFLFAVIFETEGNCINRQKEIRRKTDPNDCKLFMQNVLPKYRRFAAETVVCAIWLAWSDSCCVSDANIEWFQKSFAKSGETRRLLFYDDAN